MNRRDVGSLNVVDRAAIGRSVPANFSFQRSAMTKFQKLNDGWNAEPNAPDPRVTVEGRDVVVSFLMNPFRFGQFSPANVGKLRFLCCQRYRLGATNDEGWYRGQCRFSQTAPHWGEFYEVEGDLRLEECPNDWLQIDSVQQGSRHFLFYFRDATFECDASDWTFEVLKAEPGSAADGSSATPPGSSEVTERPPSVG
jgi:hypothetical protein